MPQKKRKKKKRKNACIACKGRGISTIGRKCVPCKGTGKKQTQTR